MLAFLILVGVKSDGSAPAIGAVMIIAGCASAYIGGQLAKR